MSNLSRIGQQAGNYVITSVLGRGSMATVYVAEHPRIDRKVAVKVLSPHLTLQPTMAERFEREAQAAARLAHPNIIEIIDFGNLEDGSPYYTMELLKGRELRQVMGDRKSWPAGEILPYLKQICSALEMAHQHQMVHRDLKPENIFVLDGEPPTVKILDFGIAKLLEGGDAALTTTGTLLGSPAFTAPEQAAGTPEAICKQTDVYSLGVILYWMLCGKLPFEGKTSGMLTDQHLKDAPPPLLSINGLVPPDVAALVHRCLEKRPADRPASARDLARQFEDGLRKQNQSAADALEQKLEATSSAAGDGLPDEEMSKSLLAFLGVDEQEPEASPREAAADRGTDAPVKLPARIPAPPPPPGTAPPPEMTPAPPPKVAVPVLPPRVPSPVRSNTSAGPLDLPPPLEAAELLPADGARENTGTGDQPPPVTRPPPARQPPPVAASHTAERSGQTAARPGPRAAAAPASPHSTGILCLEELTAEPAGSGAPPFDAEEPELDDRPTEAALPLLDSALAEMDPGRPTEMDLPLLGDAPGLEDDQRSTEIASPLLDWSSASAPAQTEQQAALLGAAEEMGQAEDSAHSTSVLGLIGDETERCEVLGLSGAARPAQDNAQSTSVLGLIGDETERHEVLGIREETDQEVDDAAETTVVGLIGDRDD